MFSVKARDFAVAEFRHQVYDRIGFLPFAHQADWQLASEGWTLHDAEPSPGERYVDIAIPDPTDHTFTEQDRHQRLIAAKRRVTPRISIARNLANLAAYKAGKSYGTSAWATGFAVLPKARVEFIGLEYSTSEMEFEYLAEFLLSERGMNLKYDRFINNIEQGKMSMELKNGMIYRCRSWLRKEGLKGKKITAYIWTEAYQLPGMSPYTSLKQNLRELRGFSAWVTTPDDPWVRVLHDRGHNQDFPDWHCTCGVKDSANPITFSQKDRDADDPSKNGMMTQERFDINHNGLIGSFIGRVYSYQRGSHLFSPLTHPQIYLPQIVADQPYATSDIDSDAAFN